MPSAQPNFLTKRLDVWVNADSPWMDMRHVERGRGSEAVEELRRRGLLHRDRSRVEHRHRRGREALPAPDPREESEDEEEELHAHYYAFGRFYIPEEVAEDSDNSQYQGWANAGRLIETGGNIIDQNAIQDDLRLDKDHALIKAVGYDPFQATKFATELLEEGFPMVEVGATVKNFSAPMKEVRPR
jgi:phage terminase large subunit-like protein